MQINAVFISLIAVILAVAGQVLWKMSVSSLNMSLFINVGFLAGTALYLASTIAYLYAVSRFPLSLIYPFMGLTFVIVLFPSYYLLGERIDGFRIFGAILITIGIAISALGNK